jgi:hypothetical protein
MIWFRGDFSLVASTLYDHISFSWWTSPGDLSAFEGPGMDIHETNHWKSTNHLMEVLKGKP